jgi:hypothetical protein
MKLSTMFGIVGAACPRELGMRDVKKLENLLKF